MKHLYKYLLYVFEVDENLNCRRISTFKKEIQNNNNQEEKFRSGKIRAKFANLAVYNFLFWVKC